MSYYERRLPHWHPEGAEYSVTWRLFGSLPKSAYPRPSMPSGRAFVILDRELDAATTGPLWLKVPSVADCVSRVLLAGASQWGLYDLTAWVVMANHIHLLLQPLLPLSRALMNIKSASARVANALLHRARRPFWQDESYDHWVRSEEERRRIIRYIERNPVKAGLVPAPEAWPWSSAGGQGMALPHSE